MRTWHWAVVCVLIVALGGVVLYKVGGGNGNGDSDSSSPFRSTKEIMRMAYDEADANRLRREANDSYRAALLQPIKDVIQYIDDLEDTWDDYDSVSEDLKGRARQARTLLQDRLKQLEDPLGVPAGGSGN